MESAGPSSLVHGIKATNCGLDLHFWLTGAIAACGRSGLQRQTNGVALFPLLIRGARSSQEDRSGVGVAPPVLDLDEGTLRV
jgi:hypothetical protein